MYELEIQVDIWGFVNPYNYEVWICWLISMPVFVFAMGLSDLFTFHKVDWDTLTSFVLRNAVYESPPISPDTKLYHRVFVIFWLWAVLILTQSYAGNNS